MGDYSLPTERTLTQEGRGTTSTRRSSLWHWWSSSRSEGHRGGTIEFRATIEQSGKTATGIRVPDDVVAGLGAGKRPAVRVTIRGHTYRSTVASMGGAFMVGVSAENRASAGVVGGDEVDVDIELDTAPREVTVPADFAKALMRDAAAKRTFDGLSYSNKQ
jgi:hypothetical protein